MPVTSSLDAATLAATAASPPAITPAVKTIANANSVSYTFLRAEASSGASAGHLMCAVVFPDGVSITVDTNDTNILTAADATALRTVAMRCFAEACAQRTTRGV